MIAFFTVTFSLLAIVGGIVYYKGTTQKKVVRNRADAARQKALRSGASRLKAEKEATLAMVSSPVERAQVEKEIEKLVGGKTEAQAEVAVKAYQEKLTEEKSGIVETLKEGVKETVADVKQVASNVVEFVLDKEQEYLLSKLAPAAQDKFKRLIVAIEKMGYSVWVNPNALVRTFKDGGEGSAHTYGLALDLNLRKGGKSYTQEVPYTEWEKTGVPALARSMGFRWGGDFTTYKWKGKKDWTNRDPVHFDLKDQYDTVKLAAKAKAKYGNLATLNKSGIEFVS